MSALSFLIDNLPIKYKLLFLRVTIKSIVLLCSFLELIIIFSIPFWASCSKFSTNTLSRLYCRASNSSFSLSFSHTLIIHLPLRCKDAFNPWVMVLDFSLEIVPIHGAHIPKMVSKIASYIYWWSHVGWRHVQTHMRV